MGELLQILQILQPYLMEVEKKYLRPILLQAEEKYLRPMYVSIWSKICLPLQRLQLLFRGTSLFMQANFSLSRQGAELEDSQVQKRAYQIWNQETWSVDEMPLVSRQSTIVEQIVIRKRCLNWSFRVVLGFWNRLFS